jgi:hypothetical protein
MLPDLLMFRTVFVPCQYFGSLSMSATTCQTFDKGALSSLEEFIATIDS